MWPDVVGRRGRPTDRRGGSQRGVNDVAGAARGRAADAAHAARVSFRLDFPDGSSGDPPTVRTAGSEAALRVTAAAEHAFGSGDHRRVAGGMHRGRHGALLVTDADHPARRCMVWLRSR